MSAPPATRPIVWPNQTIAPQSASRHPSQFSEQYRPAASGPRVCVPRPPASTATTWWPFRPVARPGQRARLRAYFACTAGHRRPTASPARAWPKQPPPRGRVRQDPIPTQARASAAGATALANKSGSERMMRGGGDRKASLPVCLAAARARSWHRMRRGNYCPAAKKGGPSGLGTFWIDDATPWSRRGLVRSEAKQWRGARADQASSAPQSDRPPLAQVSDP